MLIHAPAGVFGTARLELGRAEDVVYVVRAQRATVSEIGGIPIDVASQDFVDEIPRRMHGA